MGKVRHSLACLLIPFLIGSCSGVVTGTGSLTPGSEEGSGSDDGSSDGSSGSSTGIEAGGETVPGGGAGGAGESGGGAAGSSDSLYEGGPVDIPIPIAKVESIDPRYVVVTLSGNLLTLRGEAGAVTNVSASPQVWTQDSLTGEIKTTASNSDGSFATITFTYSAPQPSTSVTVAGYDGTNIGTPVFLKVSDNLYVWILTNGASVSRGSLAMDDDRVYMVIHVDGTGTPAPALTKRGERGSATSSYLYTIDVGGIPQIMSTGDIIIEQLFVTQRELLARSGNNFYIPDGTSFKKLFSIGSAETIDKIDVESDHNGKQWIAIATDRAAYVCDRSGSCTEILDFDANSLPGDFPEVVVLHWSKGDIDYPDLYLSLVWTVETGDSTTTVEWSYRTTTGLEEGEELFFGWPQLFETDKSDRTPNSAGAYIHKRVFIQDQVDYGALNYRPATWVTKCPSSPPADALTELEATVIEVPWRWHYLLDAEITVNTNNLILPYGNVWRYIDSICYAKRTRIVYNAEIHPDENLFFFCAEDHQGKGQIYTLIGNKLEESGDDGLVTGSGQTGYKAVPDDAIVQITEGEEHCTREKNWKIDRYVAPDGDGTTNAVVIVNTVDPTKPQIQFIDPYNEPLLADYLN